MSDCLSQIPELLEKIGFSDLSAKDFYPAFTHSSYTFEHNMSENECYERLEFLGDAVLKLCVSKILFNRHPNFQEGKMTNIRAILVSDDFLFHLAEDINLKKYIRMAKSLDKSGGRVNPSISACVFEAFLGTLFSLDVPIERISKFLETLYDKYIKDINSFLPRFNSKALLQEYTQARNNDRPEYVLASTSGDETNLTFHVQVLYHGEIVGVGSGKTKKQAEREAAYQACLKWNINGD